MIKVIGTAECAAGIPEWCFKTPCRKEVQEFHDRIAVSLAEPKDAVTLPWAEPGEEEDDDADESSTDEEDDTAARIAKLKEELKRLESRGKTKESKIKKAWRRSEEKTFQITRQEEEEA